MTDRVTDPVALAAALIRCPSVTPGRRRGARRLASGWRRRAFARAGRPRRHRQPLRPLGRRAGPVLGFNGHTDVVPPGDPAAWTPRPLRRRDRRRPPVRPRGAVDMKCGRRRLRRRGGRFRRARRRPSGSDRRSPITGDEEGDGHRRHRGRCSTGWRERASAWTTASSASRPAPRGMGDTIKIGRRGSLTARLTAYGRAGPRRLSRAGATTRCPALVRLLDRLAARAARRRHARISGPRPWRSPPSTSAIRPPTSSRPRRGRRVNIRFNDAAYRRQLSAWIEEEAGPAPPTSSASASPLRVEVSGESFLTAPGPFTDLVAAPSRPRPG